MQQELNDEFWSKSFESGRATWGDFQLASPEELKLFYNHRKSLLSGVITHQFHLHGNLVVCVRADTQGGEALPQHIKDLIEKRKAEDPEYQPKEKGLNLQCGIDGSLDEDGNIRRIPEDSAARIVPPLKKLAAGFKTYADFQHKYHNSEEKIDEIRDVKGTNVLRNYATYFAPTPLAKNVYGGMVTLTVWKPEGRFSIGQVWFSGNENGTLQTIEVGWQVDVQQYKDGDPHFFTYTTTDDYKPGFGGANLGAPYYTQVGGNVWPPGLKFQNWSQYDGIQVYLRLDVEWSVADQSVYLIIDNEPVGYWNLPLYPNMQNGSTTFQTGGEVDSVALYQMGSGYKGGAGLKKAALAYQIQCVDDAGQYFVPNLLPNQTDKDQYTVSALSQQPKGAGFYYGGPK